MYCLLNSCLSRIAKKKRSLTTSFFLELIYFCVGEKGKFQDGLFDFHFESIFSGLDEAFMLHSTRINSVDYCLMPQRELVT